MNKLLMLAMALALTACGSDPPQEYISEDANDTRPSATAAPTQPTPRPVADLAEACDRFCAVLLDAQNLDCLGRDSTDVAGCVEHVAELETAVEQTRRVVPPDADRLAEGLDDVQAGLDRWDADDCDEMPPGESATVCALNLARLALDAVFAGQRLELTVAGQR